MDNHTTVRLTTDLDGPTLAAAIERELERRALQDGFKSAAPPALPTKRPKPESKEARAKQVRLEVKADSMDDDERTFTGLASTWDIDLGGDVIHKGAFKQTLNHWRSAEGRVIPLLDSHNAWGSVRNVLGKMVDAKETDAGLEATFTVIDGPDGDEIWRRLKSGLITGLSIGYRPVKIEMPTDDEERAGVWRHLKEVELREVSVVLWPMNEGARIDTDSVKGLLEAVTALEAQDTLSDEEKAELRELHAKIGGMLGVADSGQEAPEGTEGKDDDAPPAEHSDLDPNDEKRQALEARLRDARLRSMDTRRWKASA